MRLLIALLLAALAGGCSDAESAKPRMTRQERLEAAEIQLGKTPVPRTYRYADGELRVIQVPLANGYFVEQQNCIVWRDFELRTSSISCAQATDPLAEPPAPN